MVAYRRTVLATEVTGRGRCHSGAFHKKSIIRQPVTYLEPNAQMIITVGMPTTACINQKIID